MDALNSSEISILIPQPAAREIVDTNQLLKAISHSKTMINPMEIKNKNSVDSVIIQGFSGVGKSSMILTLSGQQIIAYHHPDTGMPILATRNPEGKGGVRIEQKIFAGTVYPACSEFTKEVNKDGKTVLLWDMPGIGQNRGLTQTLINSYYYTRIFQVEHNIKIVFAINHVDMDFSMKGINIQRSFTDFLKMFGDIAPFQRSILLVITKAPANFTKQNAIQCFKIILTLPVVNSNKAIFNFIQKLAGGKIPIVIFHHPTFYTGKVIPSNPEDVTSQYKVFTSQFYSAVKSILPTKEIKLNSPAMSTAERNKCSQFVQQTQNLINVDSANLINNLNTYLRQFYSTNIENNRNLKARIKSMAQMRTFVAKFHVSINTTANPQKQQLKFLLARLHQYLVQSQKRSFCVRGIDNKIHCEVMESLANNLIMVNFLNNLSFHKEQNYAFINQTEVMKTFFQNLRNWNISLQWGNYETSFRKKMTETVVNLFKTHLQGWQSSEIYRYWRQSFTYFPSLTLRQSKFIKSKKELGNFAVNYFEQIMKVDQSVSLKTQPMVQINQLLKQSKKQLNFELQETVMTSTIIPMINGRQRELITKVINYDAWESGSVDSAIDEYSKLNPGRDNLKPLTVADMLQKSEQKKIERIAQLQKNLAAKTTDLLKANTQVMRLNNQNILHLNNVNKMTQQIATLNTQKSTLQTANNTQIQSLKAAHKTEITTLQSNQTINMTGLQTSYNSLALQNLQLRTQQRYYCCKCCPCWANCCF